MVRSIVVTILLFLGFYLIDQNSLVNNKMVLSLSFDKDSVMINDSLKVFLTFENKSTEQITFYPEAIIGLAPFAKYFIFYENPERIYLALNNTSNYNNIVVVNSGEKYKLTYSIIVDDGFFSIGEHKLTGSYHIFEETYKRKMLFRKKRELLLSLRSKPVTIIVQNDINTID